MSVAVEQAREETIQNERAFRVAFGQKRFLVQATHRSSECDRVEAV